MPLSTSQPSDTSLSRSAPAQKTHRCSTASPLDLAGRYLEGMASSPSQQTATRSMLATEANPGASAEEHTQMARRRFQRGQLSVRGKKQRVWVARWREDVVLPDGGVRRPRRCEVLGTLKEYPTRLAERALDQRLAEINSLTYQPRPTATFREFGSEVAARRAIAT